MAHGEKCNANEQNREKKGSQTYMSTVSLRVLLYCVLYEETGDTAIAPTILFYTPTAKKRTCL